MLFSFFFFLINLHLLKICSFSRYSFLLLYFRYLNHTKSIFLYYYILNSLQKKLNFENFEGTTTIVQLGKNVKEFLEIVKKLSNPLKNVSQQSEIRKNAGMHPSRRSQKMMFVNVSVMSIVIMTIFKCAMTINEGCQCCPYVNDS